MCMHMPMSMCMYVQEQVLRTVLTESMCHSSTGRALPTSPKLTCASTAEPSKQTHEWGNVRKRSQAHWWLGGWEMASNKLGGAPLP